MDAAVEIDHYAILGLPSGEEGAKLSNDEIKKAYRAKALISHPDKNPNDPLAHSNFQKLKTSYEILSDATARSAFDALLAAKLDRLRHHARLDSKRRRMMDDLDRRERAGEASPVDPSELDRRKEEAAAKKFQQEVARIREMYAKKMAEGTKKGDDRDTAVGANAEVGDELDKEKILKVSWEREGEDYSAARLKEVFGRFGEVEDVVIRAKGSKKRRSALIVMKSKAAAVSATRNMCGDLSNPLLVLPLHSNAADLPSASPTKYAEPETPNLGNLVGAGYQAYEDSILKKLQKKRTIPGNVPRSLSVPVRNVVILRSASFSMQKELGQTNTNDGQMSPRLEDGDEEIPEDEAGCRICFDDMCGRPSLKLECICKGALSLLHEECAMRWFGNRGNKKCDVCAQEILNFRVTLYRFQSSAQDRQQHFRQNSSSQLTR